MDITIDKNRLVPTVSSPRMRHRSDTSDKTYQGHLSYLPALDLWVAWVQHGKTGAKQARTLLTKTATGSHAATQALNAKLYAKQHRNRDLYSLIDGSPSGQIDPRAADEAAQLMQAAMDLAA
jgi:hypothetical protein